MIIESQAYPYKLEITRSFEFAELNMIDDSDIYSSGRRSQEKSQYIYRWTVRPYLLFCFDIKKLNVYRTRAIITRSWLETALEY